MMKYLATLTLSLGFLTWVNVASAQGTIYKWTDGKGTIHYSNTPTGEARAIDDELPPAPSFGTPSNPLSQTAAEASAPEQVAVADSNDSDESVDAAEDFEPAEEAEFDDTGAEEDFALGQDGPFGSLDTAEYDD